MLAPWKKGYDKLRQNIKKQGYYSARKGLSMVFPVVMYGYEIWTIKKTEGQRIHAFELSCWRRLLRVLWTSRRWNQSTLKEISPEYSLEGLMLKLKLQYFGYLMWRTDTLEKTLMLERLKVGGEGVDREYGWMALPTRWTWVWASSRSWWSTGKPGVLQSTGSERVGHNWVTEQKINYCNPWTWTTYTIICIQTSFKMKQQKTKKTGRFNVAFLRLMGLRL